jgi:hypothetical protein
VSSQKLPPGRRAAPLTGIQLRNGVATVAMETIGRLEKGGSWSARRLLVNPGLDRGKYSPTAQPGGCAKFRADAGHIRNLAHIW